MAKWTQDQLPLSPLTISGDSRNATSSPGLPDGLTHVVSLNGLTTDLSGQDRAPASPSVSPGIRLGDQTSDTCGPSGSSSSQPSGRLLSWENRLRQRLARAGLTKHSLTWKALVTPAGRRLSRLSLSAQSTSETGFGLLPTPNGTSNRGANNVAGRLDEWGGKGNPFRGTPLGKLHLPTLEMWMMGYPEEWVQLMPPATQWSRKSRQK